MTANRAEAHVVLLPLERKCCLAFSWIESFPCIPTRTKQTIEFKRVHSLPSYSAHVSTHWFFGRQAGLMRAKLKHMLVASQQVRYRFGLKLGIKLFARNHPKPKHVDVKWMYRKCLAVNLAVAIICLSISPKTFFPRHAGSSGRYAHRPHSVFKRHTAEQQHNLLTGQVYQQIILCGKTLEHCLAFSTQTSVQRWRYPCK